jgi:hypothetical protein
VDKVEAAAAHIRAALGIEPTEAALFERLAGQLADDEAEVVTAALRRSPADRRHYAVAGLAAASQAMDVLGVGWWHEARVRTGRTVPADDRSPATLLRSPDGDAEQLGNWAADDVADHLWGPPVGYVDLNNPKWIDRVPAPASARPGDRLLLAWDPGCRIVAVVEARDTGGLGTRLDGENLFAPPADLWWNWATYSATPGSPSATLPA